MNTNKIIGYVLLIAGVLLIVFLLWQTYNIFTGKSLPAQIFLKPIVAQENPQVGAYDIQGQIQNALIKIIPINYIDNSLNLAVWLILVWVLIYGGSKIAEIGVKLINGNK